MCLRDVLPTKAAPNAARSASTIAVPLQESCQCNIHHRVVTWPILINENLYNMHLLKGLYLISTSVASLCCTRASVPSANGIRWGCNQIGNIIAPREVNSTNDGFMAPCFVPNQSKFTVVTITIWGSVHVCGGGRWRLPYLGSWDPVPQSAMGVTIVIHEE